MLQNFKKLNSIDQLFALLRILALVGGLSWTILSPLPQPNRILLIYDFVFFCAYSVILYFFILLKPEKVRHVYAAALFLDLIFITLLIYFSGGFKSDFYLAFILLVALHAFYFGLKFGLSVAAISTLLYVISAHPELNSANLIILALRISFFFLVAFSMGLLARKEYQDKQRIQRLYEELERNKIELEQERDKLSKILMGIDAALVLLNVDQKIIWVNKVSEKWFGPLETLQNQLCSTALWKTDEICEDCPAERCLKSGKIESKEIEIRRESKDIRSYRITAAPLFNEEGKIDRILELIQDITQEKELNMHVIHSSKLAAVGELASGVAHEINNPLSSIAVCIQEITESLDNSSPDENKLKTVKECLNSMKTEIKRCKKITTGLLDIARKSSHRRVPLNINQLVRNVLMLVHYKAEKEHKTIQLNLDPKLPIIMGEADELSQVFVNLILNALEFTPTGGNIEISSGLESNSALYVQIRHEGSGIPSYNLQKIFDPFFTTKPPGAGTGLGLPISLRIVKAHGGKIKVDSKINKGTSFTVLLPVNAEPD